MTVILKSQGRAAIEDRFRVVFDHLTFLTAYAQRRGAADPDAIAAEAMTIAWRRLADVPQDDARPWLIGTARNLILADRRRRGAAMQDLDHVDVPAPPEAPAPMLELDPTLEAALAALSPQDREALLLVAWEDLTPSQAAASLGVSAPAFRVRLYRSRRRLINELRARERHTTVDPRQPQWERS
jgi:RNA polymerase sigma-70 factor, ECF subfamily